MAKEINPEDVSWSRTRAGRHNWKQWFDGTARLLLPGEDFTSTAASMRAGALAQVKNFPHVKSIRTKVDPETGGLYLQAIHHDAVPAADEAAPEAGE